jgi:hypothetical protein
MDNSFDQSPFLIDAYQVRLVGAEEVVGLVHGYDTPRQALFLGLLLAAWLADCVSVGGSFLTDTIHMASGTPHVAFFGHGKYFLLVRVTE